MTKTKNNSTIATVGIPFSILGLSTLKGICNTVYGRIATAEGKKLPDLRASMDTDRYYAQQLASSNLSS